MVNIGNGLPYIPSGFRLDGAVDEGDVTWGIQAVNTTITQGQALAASAGYIQPIAGAFGTTFVGFALFANVTTTPAGTTKNIAWIRPNRNKAFWAPVLSAALVTQAAVGTLCNLFSTTGIGVDITSNSPTAYGFQVDDFDASTLAIAANAAGFVRGFIIPSSE